MKTFVVGTLKSGSIINPTLATHHQNEANLEAKSTSSNVYQVVDGKFYLRKIYAVKF